jgi:thiamine-phosphate pyrophosphorylase
VISNHVASRPLLCLVTDRRRLAERLGLGDDINAILDRLVEQAADAAEAGVDWIQVRERDLDARALSALVSRIVRATRGRAKVIVNDRADVALATRSAGVHLRERSAPADRIRNVLPHGFLVGQSLHQPAAVAKAGPVDYVIFGTVFPSKSKPAATTVWGTAGLAAACHSSPVPVLAIGGVTVETSAHVAAAGAAGVAAIDLFLPPSAGSRDPGLHEIVSRLHESFDSARSVS